VKANILVIDDEESIRFTFEKFLASAGHSVVTAGNCGEARGRIDEGGFDLVFVDIILPDGTGIELLREIRSKRPACPVIMITAYPSVETARDTFRLGAFDYITKPVRQQEVMDSTIMALQVKQNGKGKRSRRNWAAE
jgi:two-component system, NtrC family, response regulator HydG